MRKTTTQKTMVLTAALAASAALMLALTGCSGLTPTASQTLDGPQLHGSVFGGRQPIGGATLYLYAAGTTYTVGTSGYTGSNSNLLPAGTMTNPDGSFNITSQYSCTTGQQMYIVALGGNTGAAAHNPQAGILAALGDCAALKASAFISMNEVTTVAGVFALSPFMSGYASVGTSANNIAGLTHAFVNAGKLANTATGVAGGPALPTGATAPASEIYTLADVLAACVNTTGGSASDTSTTCGQLFAYATPSGGTAPTETIGLALAIAKNPALNTANEFGYATPQSPYSPRLVTAPNDWTMSINYTGFNAPKSTTVDANGQVWVANSGNNTVTTLAQTGAVTQTLTGNGLNAPAAIAIDSSGNAWVANKGGSTVSVFTNGGGTFGSSPFTVGTAPDALAFDTNGNAFVANYSGNSITELSSSGAAIQTITAGITAPSAVAIDPK